jgi:UDP-N-acetylglucosamine--N-acetylmuramyl-(pentapeptide) pyrophosphoryl-undecaprenol N-acetylglucosamine transferase
MEKAPKIILSGGGTGGHIFPAVAIANELKKMRPDAEILFVGALGKMEMEKVPAAGYKIIGVPIAGLQRRLTLANLKLPFLIIRSLMATRKIIRDFQPDVAVGTGGYASGPLLRAASSKGIPVLLQEQNSYAGITNKILSKKAARICVAYEGMEKFFPAKKIVLTGNPVRQDLSHAANLKAEAQAYFKLHSDKKTILVIGGSLGARTINESLLAGLDAFEAAGIQVVWQTGKAYYQKINESVSGKNYQGIFVHEFISRMDLAYACADLVISRAGASSVSELCNLGKAAILVPSPNVAEDHQTKNAMALVNRQAADVVKDSDANKELVSKSIALLSDEVHLKNLQKNSLSMAYPNAAHVIAQEVLKLIRS